MAKYTELFIDYVNDGGIVPSSFSLISGFEELFLRHYCDHEIGFETEKLFEIKLQEKADLFMQAYADRIQQLANAWLEYDAPVKTHYTVETRKFNAGQQEGNTTELPIDSEIATPSITTRANAYENNELHTNKIEDYGASYDEAQKRVDYLNERVKSLLVKLLDEFKPCFMQVY